MCARIHIYLYSTVVVVVVVIVNTNWMSDRNHLTLEITKDVCVRVSVWCVCVTHRTRITAIETYEKDLKKHF